MVQVTYSDSPGLTLRAAGFPPTRAGWAKSSPLTEGHKDLPPRVGPDTERGWWRMTQQKQDEHNRRSRTCVCRGTGLSWGPLSSSRVASPWEIS